MTEILEVANERWLTGDELCEQFQMFSKGWLSGRKHLTANEASGKTLREFESLTFRK